MQIFVLILKEMEVVIKSPAKTGNGEVAEKELGTRAKTGTSYKSILKVNNTIFNLNWVYDIIYNFLQRSNQKFQKIYFEYY